MLRFNYFLTKVPDNCDAGKLSKIIFWSHNTEEVSVIFYASVTWHNNAPEYFLTYIGVALVILMMWDYIEGWVSGASWLLDPILVRLFN